GIDEDEADIGCGLDLGLLGAVNVGHETNDTGVAVGPCLERSRPQSAAEARRQHAHADLLDDVPDPADAVVVAHVGYAPVFNSSRIAEPTFNAPREFRPAWGAFSIFSKPGPTR